MLRNPFAKPIIRIHQSVLDYFVREMEKRMSAIQDSVAKTSAKLDTLSTKIDSAVTRIEASNAETAADLSAVDALGVKVDALESKVDALAPAPVPTPEGPAST